LPVCRHGPLILVAHHPAGKGMAVQRSFISTGLSRLWAGVLTPVKGLQAAGVEVTLLYREQVRMFTKQEVGITAVRVSSNLLLQTLAFLKQVLKRRPDHVEFYFHSGCWTALRVQAWLCRFLRIPILCVCTGSELLDFERHSKKKAKCIRSVFAKASAVILKELYMREVIRKNALIDERRTHLVSNRVHVGPEPDFGRRPPEVLFLNLFKRYRRIELIISAIPQLRAAIPDVRFKLVGMGRYPDYEAELLELARQLKVDDCVEFLPFTQDAGNYFKSAAVFVLPCKIVFCNNALLEAMERGIPPVVSKVPGAERIVDDGVNGFCVAETAEGFAEGILALLSDEVMRQAFARAARAKILERFDERQRTAELLELYQSEVWLS